MIVTTPTILRTIITRAPEKGECRRSFTWLVQHNAEAFTLIGHVVHTIKAIQMKRKTVCIETRQKLHYNTRIKGHFWGNDTAEDCYYTLHKNVDIEMALFFKHKELLPAGFV